jgi:flagellar protein FlaI
MENSIQTLVSKLKFRQKKQFVLPDYDPEIHGHLVDYEVSEDYTEIERYWIDQPYVFVSIIKDRWMKYYNVVEPSLYEYEKYLLEKVYDDLQDILVLENTDLDKDKENILIDKALSLLYRYHKTIDVTSIYKITYFLRRNFLGYESIHPLMLDPYIEDISCDGVNVPVYLYHIKYHNIMTNISFSEERLNSLVIKLCQKSGKQISIGEPLVDATMSDGSRLQATLGKEVTTRGSSFSIRRFRSNPLTPIDLIRFNTSSLEIMAYFWLVIENGKNAIFAGGTASGKTSMLNAVSLFIPPLTKIISIEDTRELTLHHDNWIAGVTRKSFTEDGTSEISMYDLLKAAMRQRPEYILVGEVRGKEALTLFQAMSTGHTTYSTMHAGDAQTVVNRLENDPINVPRVMLRSIDILSIQKQTYVNENRVRRTQSIVEFTGIDPKTGEIRINELYRWDPVNDKFYSTMNSQALNHIMQVRGWNKEDLYNEIENRKKILDYMRVNNMRDYISVSLVVHAYSTNPEVVLESIENNNLEWVISNNIDSDIK